MWLWLNASNLNSYPGNQETTSPWREVEIGNNLLVDLYDIVLLSIPWSSYLLIRMIIKIPRKFKLDWGSRIRLSCDLGSLAVISNHVTFINNWTIDPETQAAFLWFPKIWSFYSVGYKLLRGSGIPTSWGFEHLLLPASQLFHTELVLGFSRFGIFYPRLCRVVGAVHLASHEAEGCCVGAAGQPCRAPACPGVWDAQWGAEHHAWTFQRCEGSIALSLSSFVFFFEEVIF